MEVRAVARYQRLSPRKARLVTDLITGRSVDEAIAVLEHLPKASARPIGLLVRSAVANAENNFNLTMEDLYVKRALADEGPRLKRVWMRGRGRRDIKVHRTCHLTVVVEEVSQRSGGAMPRRAVARERARPTRPAAAPAAEREGAPTRPARRTRTTESAAPRRRARTAPRTRSGGSADPPKRGEKG
jgi:large subunit ribosomal protein L22